MSTRMKRRKVQIMSYKQNVTPPFCCAEFARRQIENENSIQCTPIHQTPIHPPTHKSIDNTVVQGSNQQSNVNQLVLK